MYNFEAQLLPQLVSKKISKLIDMKPESRPVRDLAPIIPSAYNQYKMRNLIFNESQMR